MLERISSNHRGVYFLVEWFPQHDTGKVREVVYDHPGDAEHALRVADHLDVPIQVESAPDEPPDST